MHLDRTWVSKQGNLFAESPIILFAAIIWFLRIYEGGKYCTFPHATKLLNKPYEKIFPILTSYPELENYHSPFMDVWLRGADEQLQGADRKCENSAFADDFTSTLLGNER